MGDAVVAAEREIPKRDHVRKVLARLDRLTDLEVLDAIRPGHGVRLPDSKTRTAFANEWEVFERQIRRILIGLGGEEEDEMAVIPDFTDEDEHGAFLG